MPDSDPDLAAVRAAAADLHARGFSPCRIAPGQKNPTDHGWTRYSAEPSEFGPGDQVGIQCGSGSDGNRPGHSLVCVDCDAAAAIEKAPGILPPTAMIDGRRSKPAAHHWFLVPNDTIPAGAWSACATAVHLADAVGHPGPGIRPYRHAETGKRLIDFIGTGAQAVAPPSLHPTGERREWHNGRIGTPAVVPYPDLMHSVILLAVACGHQPRETRPAGPPPLPADAGRMARLGWFLRYRVNSYLDACPPAVAGHGGHDRTYAVTCRLVWAFALPPAVAYHFLARRYNPRCSPPWTEAELWHKVRCAVAATDHRTPRGHLRAARKGSSRA